MLDRILKFDISDFLLEFPPERFFWIFIDSKFHKLIISLPKSETHIKKVSNHHNWKYAVDVTQFVTYELLIGEYAVFITFFLV